MSLMYHGDCPSTRLRDAGCSVTGIWFQWSILQICNIIITHRA